MPYNLTKIINDLIKDHKLDTENNNLRRIDEYNTHYTDFIKNKKIDLNLESAAKLQTFWMKIN